MDKIGILGGGQLALMLGMSCKCANKEVIIYSDVSDFPAHVICDDYFVGSFNDVELLKTFVDACDVVIYEFENIQIDHLLHVDQSKLFSKLDVLRISQNRILEKKLAKKLGLKTPEYQFGNGFDELNAVDIKFPSILKTTRFGYDGKGQVSINDNHSKCLGETIATGEWIIEEKITFDFEGSVIFYKKDGVIDQYAAFKNLSENGILMESEVLCDDQKYFDYFKVLVEAIDFNGILCVEFFVKDEQIYFNEIAPRVHNSGHITLKSHLASQFDNLINLVLGYPVDNTRLTDELKMMQVLGQDYKRLKTEYNIFDYGKLEAKVDRKMGHYIILKGDINV